ncbi:hypothetical protein MetMK1DRAFT_00027880 [Metallosphaera yellowstonensis MK1]|uniref:Uncharacterized protein n=1 Tax=Metallosphaera yellowstonensis MK1 TaxID=671065 RepID=H2C882_9CREN|nr:C166 family protein [Metallosphaera yellowstonensis]EHP68358.1 hypothetical protein MetMK1DRAFT_00027880 [Metallosphaera yellowstonensis MK1]
MGTKLIVYVLFFDIFLALMAGAYSGLSAPSIPATPSYTSAVNLASSIVWSAGIPSITLVPSFSILGTTVPSITIPSITFFSISFSWLAPVIYVFDWIIWTFVTIASVMGYLLSIFTGSVSLLASVPVVGPFLTAFTLIINFILIWELVKLIRGYGP